MNMFEIAFRGHVALIADEASPRKKRRLSEIDTNLLHTLVPGTFRALSTRLQRKRASPVNLLV